MRVRRGGVVRVRIVLTVELDESQWVRNFGLEDPHEVPEDVRTHVHELVSASDVFGDDARVIRGN